jgi:glucokinase
LVKCCSLNFIAIAGPVIDNAVKMANTDWSTSVGSEIESRVSIKPFVFINDFQSVAYALLGL